jgi:hypothetical protein
VSRFTPEYRSVPLSACGLLREVLRKQHGSGHHSIQMPTIGNTLELVLTGVAEAKTRSGHQILDRLGHEYFRCCGGSADPGTDRDGESPHIVAVELDFTRVEASSYFDPELPYVLDDRASAEDGTSRTLKGRQEPVSHRLDLPAIVPGKL